LSSRLAIVVFLLAANQPAHGRSFLSSLAPSLRARCTTVTDSLKNTAFCIDVFAGANMPKVGNLHAGGALKINLPSYSGWAKARAEGRRPRLLYLSAGVSNSVAFTGYNPLFGGWNASYTLPIHSGFGAGLFAGGPYTGFYLNTPFWVSLGGWVDDTKNKAAKQPPPDPFAAVTLSVPLLSRLGLCTGVRLWIFSPMLKPLVRPFKRPVWWLHEQRKEVVCRAKRQIRALGRWMRCTGQKQPLASAAPGTTMRPSAGVDNEQASAAVLRKHHLSGHRRRVRHRPGALAATWRRGVARCRHRHRRARRPAGLRRHLRLGRPRRGAPPRRP
jgi:hypothetical protein